MSPSVGNFVHDLVEMAKAMETLPLVQAELERYRDMHLDDGDRIARLEQRLIDRANEMDALYAKLRSVEAERDDASFRQLEAEDKVTSVLREVGALQAALRGIEVTLNPPKPEPIPEPTPAVIYAETPQDQGAPSPTPNAPAGEQSQEPASVSYSAPEVATSVEPVQPIVPVSEAGQSVADPTSAPIAISSKIEEAAEVGAAISAESASTEPKPGKYFGRRYYDIPIYVSMADWLANGGSHEDYYWRPAHQVG